MADDDHALLLQMSVDLRRLQKDASSAEGIADKSLTAMEKRAKKAAQNLEEAFSFKNANLGGALGEILQSSRLKVLDTATARIGLFGGALESLGPIGLAAAAGVGAFGFAIDKSIKTADWAEDLLHASKTLGLTTTQLQKFDLFAQASGIPVEKMRESLSGLNRTIGLVDSGLARSMQTKAFTALHISPEDLRGWGTLDKQLPHILDALAKLGAGQREAFASRMHIDPEVLERLVDERKDFEEVSAAAAKYGIIMDEAAVKKTAEAAHQMHLAGAVMQGELRIAFADMAPAIGDTEMKMAGLIKSFTDFTGGIMGAVGALDQWLSRMDKVPGAEKAADAKSSYFGAFGAMMLDNVVPGFREVTTGAKAISAYGNAKKADDARRAKLADWSPGTDMSFATNQLTPQDQQLVFPKGPSPRKESNRDDTVEFTKTADEDLDKALKALDQAYAALTTNVADHAKFESKAIDQEAAEQQAKLTADRAKLLADKTIDGKTSDILQAKIEEAQAAVESARQAKQEELRRKTFQAVTDEVNKYAEQQLTGQVEMARAEQGVFQTTQNRRALALKIFALEETIQENKLKEVIASKTVGDTERQLATLQLQQLEETKQLRQQAVSQNNPGSALDAFVQDAQNAGKDAQQMFAKDAVSGLDAFNSALIDSQGRIHSFFDAFKKGWLKFDADLEQQGLKTLEGAALGQGGPLGGLGKMLGVGKGAGVKPDGSKGKPFYVVMAQQAGQGLSGIPGLGGIGNFLSGLFGGGGAAAGSVGSGMSSMASMLAFADGGSFNVGGRGGIDKNIVAFKASSNEHVTVQTPQQQRAGAGLGAGGNSATLNIYTQDADSFRKSGRQITREWQRRVG